MPAMRFLVRSAKRRLFIGLYPFTVLCAAPIALMLFLVYSGIADNLFGIQDMAHNVRTEYLPSILRAQRALSDISTLRRHAEHIMDMDDPVMRRRNRIMAHAIANRGMFSDDPEIARNGQELARRIRELAELRNRADHAQDNLHVAAFRLTEAVSDLSRFLSRAAACCMSIRPEKWTETASVRWWKTDSNSSCPCSDCAPVQRQPRRLRPRP